MEEEDLPIIFLKYLAAIAIIPFYILIFIIGGLFLLLGWTIENIKRLT
jgi:hypothetical protein